jgi:hypothetical protein
MCSTSYLCQEKIASSSSVKHLERRFSQTHLLAEFSGFDRLLGFKAQDHFALPGQYISLMAESPTAVPVPPGSLVATPTNSRWAWTNPASTRNPASESHARPSAENAVFGAKFAWEARLDVDELVSAESSDGSEQEHFSGLFFELDVREPYNVDIGVCSRDFWSCASLDEVSQMSIRSPSVSGNRGFVGHPRDSSYPWGTDAKLKKPCRVSVYFVQATRELFFWADGAPASFGEPVFVARENEESQPCVPTLPDSQQYFPYCNISGGHVELVDRTSSGHLTKAARG